MVTLAVVIVRCGGAHDACSVMVYGDGSYDMVMMALEPLHFMVEPIGPVDAHDDSLIL